MLQIDSGLPLGLQGVAAPYRFFTPSGRWHSGQPTNRHAPSRRGDCFCCDVVTGELDDGGRPPKAACLDVKNPPSARGMHLPPPNYVCTRAARIELSVPVVAPVAPIAPIARRSIRAARCLVVEEDCRRTRSIPDGRARQAGRLGRTAQIESNDTWRESSIPGAGGRSLEGELRDARP